jgi:hypothetical protein
MKPLQSLILLLITLPGIVDAQSAQRSVVVLNPVLPDSLNELQVRFEVKQIRSKQENRDINICYLSANILNQEEESVQFLLCYSYMDQKREKILTVAPNQKRIVLVDKQITNPIAKSELKLLFRDLKIHPITSGNQRNTGIAQAGIPED